MGIGGWQVTDFGLANWNFSRKGTMRTACGTPNYIAPEVKRDLLVCENRPTNVWKETY
jgi:serine/threonine protein kinase